MPRSLTIQTLGTVVVPLSLLLADLSVRVLDACPGWPVAWYVHLAVFAPLDQAKAVPSLLAAAFTQTGTLEPILLLGLAVCMRLARFRFGVALLAHLALGASLIIGRAWIVDSHGTLALALLKERDASGTCFVAMLLAATGVACSLAHRTFLKEIAAMPPLRARLFADWMGTTSGTRTRIGAATLTLGTSPVCSSTVADTRPRMA